jgi:hypothetical protein
MVSITAKVMYQGASYSIEFDSEGISPAAARVTQAIN